MKEISIETPVVRCYFNNHYSAKAVVNALQFKGMLGDSLSEIEKQALNCSRLLPSEGSLLSTRTSNT